MHVLPRLNGLGLITTDGDTGYCWKDDPPHTVEVWTVGRLTLEGSKRIQWRDVPPEVREAFVRQG